VRPREQAGDIGGDRCLGVRRREEDELTGGPDACVEFVRSTQELGVSVLATVFVDERHIGGVAIQHRAQGLQAEIRQAERFVH